jgi:hypothetical protein
MRRLDIFRNDMGTVSVALQHSYETPYGQDWVTEKGLLLPAWPRIMHTMSDDPWNVTQRFQALQPSLHKTGDTTPTPNQSKTPKQI